MGLTLKLNAVIDTALAEDRIVGAVVLVAENGELVYGRAAGHADREGKKPVTDDTIFRLASVTKPIVAATALALVDKFEMRLDAPVTDYLEWFTPALADGSRPAITIHHLLTHTAGLTYRAEMLATAGVTAGLDNVSIPLQDNIRRLAEVPLLYEPGAAWEYGMAIDVLGAVIEAVSGKTLAEAVEEQITGPLGMTDTRFGVADETRLAVAYADGKDGAVPMGQRHDMADLFGEGMPVFEPGRILNPNAFQSGGAGMAGTAPDFLRFLEALQRGGEPILSSKITSLGLSNRIGKNARPDAPGDGFGYFGAVVRDQAASNGTLPRGAVHWGGIYGNSWLFDPGRKLSVVGYTNTTFEGCDGRFRSEVRSAVYG